jgi:hypothetical protein
VIVRRQLAVVGAAAIALVLAAAAPVHAAVDPTGDAAACPHLSGTGTQRAPHVPDLVSAEGEIVELGTSVRFTIRFADDLVTPDASGHPYRVEVVLFDPEVPPVDAGLYRDVNRILRYDAIPDGVTTTLLLPEAGQSRFLAPAIDGDTLVFQVPGRTLVADEDETGTSPGVQQLRWGVIVRDEGGCDLLGDGRPVERLVMLEDADAVIEPSPAVEVVAVSGGSSSSAAWWIATAAVVAALVVASAIAMRRRARDRGAG